MGQEQPKYHVADDGKVFVVNDDGTSTEYGYVLKRRRMLIPNYVVWFIAILSGVVVVFGSAMSLLSFGRISDWKFDDAYYTYYTYYYNDAYYTYYYNNYEAVFTPCLMLLVLILAGCVIRLYRKALTINNNGTRATEISRN